MHFYLIIFALMIAAFDWIAVNQEWKKLEYFAKPMVIVILITWLLVNGGYQVPTLFFLIGLVLSLAGDIFLMLPDEKFLAGLVSFLFAHLAYIRGFSFSGLHFSIGLLFVIILVGLVGIVVLRQLMKGLTVHHQEKLRFPIIIYAIVISIMLITALSTMISPSPGWSFYPSIIVSTGTILFFFSDSTLAWNRFVNLLPHGKLMVIISYHIAQIAITLGVGLNFLS